MLHFLQLVITFVFVLFGVQQVVYRGFTKACLDVETAT